MGRPYLSPEEELQWKADLLEKELHRLGKCPWECKYCYEEAGEPSCKTHLIEMEKNDAQTIPTRQDNAD